MARHLSISNFKRYPPAQALLWSLITIIIVEITLHVVSIETGMEENFRDIRQRVVLQSAPDIQILGDSVSAGGILSTLLCNDSSISVRNDSVAGGGPAFSYLLLKSEISAGNIPSTVILAHSPHTFSGVRFPILVGRFANAREIAALAWHSKDFPGILYGVLTKLSVVLSNRDAIKEILKGNNGSFLTAPATRLTEKERLNSYYQSVDANTFQPNQLRNGLLPMYKEPFTVSELNRLYFEKLLVLAKDHNIRTLIVTMPVLQRVASFRETILYTERYWQFMDHFAQDNLIEYLQKDFLIFEDQDFSDHSHLNIRGAIRFTSKLRDLTNGCDILIND